MSLPTALSDDADTASVIARGLGALKPWSALRDCDQPDDARVNGTLKASIRDHMRQTLRSAREPLQIEVTGNSPGSWPLELAAFVTLPDGRVMEQRFSAELHATHYEIAADLFPADTVALVSADGVSIGTFAADRGYRSPSTMPSVTDDVARRMAANAATRFGRIASQSSRINRERPRLSWQGSTTILEQPRRELGSKGHREVFSSDRAAGETETLPVAGARPAAQWQGDPTAVGSPALGGVHC